MNETLDELVGYLVDAKRREEQAKRYRIDIEEQIASMIPGPEKGSKTVTARGYKVTVERGFSYKADCVKIEELKLGDFPAPVKIKTTRELDEVGYRWFEVEHPNLFRELCNYVIVTPKKISVSIKEAKA